MPTVGIFFVADNELLLYTTALNESETYGDFRISPFSHDRVWQKDWARKYKVDFDYYPRGRVVYHSSEQKFILYIDRCLSNDTKNLLNAFGLDSEGCHFEIAFDEHYQCHKCNMFGYFLV